MTDTVNPSQMPASFKDKLRERILSQFADLIPPEQMEALINAEIKAFFETPQLLTVQSTKVEIDNPSYEPGKGHGWNNERKIQRECLAFGSHMTPFRQMVWTCLHDHLSPILRSELEKSESSIRKELDSWVTMDATPDLNSACRVQMSQLANTMAATMLSGVLKSAAQTAHYNMKMSLQAMGHDVSSLPDVPALMGSHSPLT